MGQVEVENLSKVFGDSDGEIVAIEDLDLSIADGEFLVLVGPSGCGKSTTLRCIGGLETPTEGRIVLDGEDITDQNPQDRDIAMVFQNYALYPHMTARRNMSFGLSMSTDLDPETIDERVSSVARMMEIEELLEKKPGDLSGGQQQRVALGRAIVREPELFLMDEPLSNLDAKLRTQMRTELQELQEELDTTTIYVTHDQTEAMTMGDRIAILDQGRLQQVGTPLECYHAPANRFVAGFIGSPSMNFFEVTYDPQRMVLEAEAFTQQLSEGMEAQLGPQTRELILGIRPEDVRVSADGETDSITTEIEVLEPLGDQSFLYFELDGQTHTASIGGDRVLREDDSVELVFPEDRLHFFDPATGEAVKNRELPQESQLEEVNV